MTTTAHVPAGGLASLTAEQRRHARNLGIALVLMAVATLVAFTRAHGTATFNLDLRSRGTTVGLPVGPTVWVAIVSLAAFGGGQLVRGFGRWTTSVMAAGAILFLGAFLAWAAVGQKLPLVALIHNTVGGAVPLVLGAIAGILCEQSGIINIAIEGLLLGGAFTSAIVGSLVNIWVGVFAAIGVGALLAWLLAWLAIRWKVDQVIAGFAINFLVLGLTSFLYSQVLVKNPTYNDVSSVKQRSVPLLHSIPIIGDVVFTQKPLTYVTYLMVVGVTWALFKTKWGLRTRAVGEHPKAADTLGVNVHRLRYRNVVIAGAVGGLGGTYWTLENGQFTHNITGGFGFIALAAVIIGQWKPLNAAFAALFFAFFTALQATLSNLNKGIPTELLLSMPYLATIVVVAGFIGRSRAPAAGGKPYESQ
jgi:general nucleoside transport system permease protein